jgi:hypothetical protein
MNDELHWLFAYGSNMDWDDICRWLQENGHPEMFPRQTATATLEGYKIVWNYRSVARKGGAANIGKEPGAQTPGLLLQIDDTLLGVIDKKEGKAYERWLNPFQNVDGHGQVMAWVYEVKDEYCHDRFIPPTKVYLETVLSGVQKAGLPSWHYDNLAQTPTQ